MIHGQQNIKFIIIIINGNVHNSYYVYFDAHTPLGGLSATM
jgi:hypothetical protein